jgi:hypothetical protein
MIKNARNSLDRVLGADLIIEVDWKGQLAMATAMLD